MSYDKNVTPITLLRLLLVVMASAFMIILLLSGTGLYYLYSDYIVKRAESDATSISHAFLAVKRDLLIPTFDGADESSNISVSEPEQLDSAIRQYLSPFDILKVKIFSRDRVILYSTDSSLIGKHSHNNPGLELSFTGQNYSKIKTRKSMTDIGLGERFNVDVVETYVPIYNKAGTIVGTFEIYQDMTRFRSDIVNGVSIAVSVLVVILLMVFAIALKILNFPVKKLEEAQNKLKLIASRDSLTSIYNRYAILNKLKEEVTRVSKGETTLSIILLDIDHFKSINDSYGHPTGDYVLRKVARTIQKNIPESSSVGRYGGEEFLVVLTGSHATKAAEIAEQIRRAVQNAGFECDGQNPSVTISAGTSVLGLFDTDIENLIKLADKALYSAKSQGRNQTVTARDLDIEPAEKTPALENTET